MAHARSPSRSGDLSASPRPNGTRVVAVRDARPEIGLVAVVITLIGEEPCVRVITTPAGDTRLPLAVYRLENGATLDEALRFGVIEEVALDLGHLEQLDCSMVRDAAGARNTLSIGYLALANTGAAIGENTLERQHWRSWYSFFPWEDWRRGRPSILQEMIEPRLRAWAELGAQPHQKDADAGLTRVERIRMAFGLDGIGWDEERVIERYDLMQAAGAMPDAAGDGLPADHRHTLAVAMGRLRRRIKQRPVVFELMPERFTLFELQRTVEAILGPHLHKQNFRRLVEHMGLVEPTEDMKSHTGGRPAKLFRFRQSVLIERLQPGVRVRTVRG